MLKHQFPLVICNGICGIGKSKRPLQGAPFFHAEMFSKTDDPLWKSFPSVSHFQPLYTFPVEELPFSPLSSCLHSYFDTPSTLAPLIDLFLNDASFEKVVLATKRTFTFKESLDPQGVISAIIKAFPKDRAFAYMPNSSTLFFGSSPENLFTRTKKNLTVDCIAGTVVCGDEGSLFTRKLVKEHSFVTEYVKKKTIPFLSAQRTSDLGVKSAGNVSHLYQTVSGICYDHVQDQQLINALHPTPATLGSPTSTAMEFLKDHEPFGRGMYCGVLGWMSEEKTCLKVCIRSGLVEGNTLSLFAGAGITLDSSSVDEINEIANKFKTLEEVFLERSVSNKQ